MSDNFKAARIERERQDAERMMKSERSMRVRQILHRAEASLTPTLKMPPRRQEEFHGGAALARRRFDD